MAIDARVNTASGGPEDWRKQADDWRALGGITHLTVNTMNAGLRGPDAHIERLTLAADALSIGIEDRGAGIGGRRT